MHWSPHCGYCARIAPDLAELQPALEAAGCTLVLVALGGVPANRAVAEAAGLDGPILLLAPDQDVFRAAGTPSAYHLDGAGRILSQPAYGGIEVPALARSIAGVDARTDPPGAADAVRYLLERDGLCAPDAVAQDALTWSGTRVYRLADFHVGIRHDSPATAAILDRLLVGRRVDDPRAGHSFSVALGSASTGKAETRVRGLNLLIQAGQPTLRSRDPARVLHALLSRCSDGISAFDPACGRLQVNAIAVLHQRGAALLPWNLHAFAPRLQPLLARHGIAMADVRYPEIDLATQELVVPESAVHHDSSVLDAIGVSVPPTVEQPCVRPGRYPLTTWCAIHPGPWRVVPLSPAEGAAATLSSVLHTDDAAERVRQLGRLFERVEACGLWYYAERELIAAVVAALHGD